MISNEELKSEKKYLQGVVKTLDQQLEFLNNSLYSQEKNLQETSQYMASSFYDMDAEEQGVTKQALEQLQLGIGLLADTKTLRERQRESAYFGRVDFQASDENAPNAYYIGIAHIGSQNQPLPLVLDWRAPLSSIYYDYELGTATYFAPQGTIDGKILLKRQYKTQGEKLVYAFDSSLTIGDEILKDVLGKNASAKMGNIVATIQKHQNKIIRAPEGENVIVQGVAGSGKTSIALHRVAYLLYKNHISANDILIVSPSSLFSDYISNVLPELGESNSPKITFEEIAQKELGQFLQFEPKSLMLEDIIQNKNIARQKNVQEKASFSFFENLKKYLKDKVSVSFKAKDIKLGKVKISAQEVSMLYNQKYQTKTPAVRVEWIADYIVDRLEIENKNQAAVFGRVKRILFDMFENTNIISIYQSFLSTQKMEFNSVNIGKRVFVGFEDVPALLYIKNYLLGVEIQKHFKHVIIDEMQDYSPITLHLLNIIFPAPKTILGDIYQTLEKNIDKAYLKKLALMLNAENLFSLNTTYRSTVQISAFSQKIIGLKGVKQFNRNGEAVEVLDGKTNFEKTLTKTLKKLSKQFESVALICPSKSLAEKVFNQIDKDLGFSVIDETYGEVKNRRVVMPVAMSKGLEFDAVLFVDVPSKQKIYKNIKYVACTRALHKLVVVEM